MEKLILQSKRPIFPYLGFLISITYILPFWWQACAAIKRWCTYLGFLISITYIFPSSVPPTTISGDRQAQQLNADVAVTWKSWNDKPYNQFNPLHLDDECKTFCLSHKSTITKVKAIFPLTHCMLVPKGLQSRQSQFIRFCNQAQQHPWLLKCSCDKSHSSVWCTSMTHHMLVTDCMH